MLDNSESLEQCDFCFSAVTYLLGYCPACNDTGYIKKRGKETPPFEKNDNIDNPEKYNGSDWDHVL